MVICHKDHVEEITKGFNSRGWMQYGVVIQGTVHLEDDKETVYWIDL